MSYLCLEPGCRIVVDKGRCPAHQAAFQRAVDSRENARKYWYRDSDYRRNRRLLLASATSCELCGMTGVRLTADHIVAVAASLAAGLPPDHSLANLRAACLPCNSRRNAKPKVRRVIGGMADVYGERSHES
jgi:5-methylcytosine-specific restriction endonuclease McrA